MPSHYETKLSSLENAAPIPADEPSTAESTDGHEKAPDVQRADDSAVHSSDCGTSNVDKDASSRILGLPSTKPLNSRNLKKLSESGHDGRNSEGPGSKKR